MCVAVKTWTKQRRTLLQTDSESLNVSFVEKLLIVCLDPRTKAKLWMLNWTSAEPHRSRSSPWFIVFFICSSSVRGNISDLHVKQLCGRRRLRSAGLQMAEGLRYRGNTSQPSSVYVWQSHERSCLVLSRQLTFQVCIRVLEMYIKVLTYNRL
ncbi:hypothetical protein ABVT39_012261 [Epinephelus coioides]